MEVRQFGKFRLVEHLASGGMADVWRAEMPGAAGFVKEVALKLVRGEHRQDDAFTRMFIQEARLASRLDHANVVHVFELGEVDGHYYIAMELVRGQTLREVADRCRELGVRFGVARALHVCAEVARALAYAHRLEVDGRPAELVHRDVSPQNVLISSEGEVKLADFGIARAAGAAEQTRAGTIKGKLAYMAPEQARGEPVDGRADVFALGVVLWELCAGRRLFERDTDAATLAAVLDPAPVSLPSEWNEAVGPDLDEVVLAALERDRERRPSSDELARRLSALRVRVGAADPEELDLRSLLLRLWPDGVPRRAAGEPTAVMGAVRVPVAAEPSPPPNGAGDPRDAPTRTLARPPPFGPGHERRRVVVLVSVVLFAVALSAGVLRWARGDRGGGDGGPAATPAVAVPRADGGARAAPGPARAATPELPRATSPDDEGLRGEGRAVAAPPPQPPGALPRPGGAPASDAPPRGQIARGGEGSREQRSAIEEVPSAGPVQAGAGATLIVDVIPWATVYVDGKAAGDTPLTLDLPAGAHRLRAVHPRLGSVSARVELSPGEQLRWAPTLPRAAPPPPQP